MDTLDTFWKTAQTLQQELGSGYTAFSLFSPIHLGWLALCAAACVGLGLLYRRAAPETRRRLLIGLTAYMLLDELAKYAVTLATGQWSWNFLPLHLCSINIFVCLYHTLRPGDRSREILYALCLPGALLAMLSPSWQSLPVWNFMHLHSATIHIALFLYPVLLLAGGFRPDPRRIPFVLLFLAAVSVPVYFLNKWLGTNFLFINGWQNNALTRALAAVFTPQAYLLGFVALIALLLLVLYLPWVFASARNKTPAA